MINAKKIYNAMLSDSRLTDIVAQSNIFSSYPNKEVTFPCIVFTDINQNDVEFADNKPMANSCDCQIDIYTKKLNGKKTATEIGLVVAKIFYENYFSCYNNRDVSNEAETEHRIMSFRKEILS